MNFVEGTVKSLEGGPVVNVSGSEFRLRQQLPDHKVGDKVTFGIRPEHIGLTDASGVKLADLRVDLVEQLGDTTMVYASTWSCVT
jgi:multiple sugar transport system ATP-binding protein